MRIIDDLVDNRKAGGEKLSELECRQFESMIRDWIDGIRTGRPSDKFQEELLEIMKRFCIPVWPWERLGSAMVYDLYHDGFPTFLTFRRYTEGAAIAPASIFMHLCGVNSSDEGYDRPPFDVLRVARPLAIFSYLVHIIRDFQKDHQRRLNYFPADWLREHGLNPDQLYRISNGEGVPIGLRRLVARYLSLMEYYQSASRSRLDVIAQNLPPRYKLSLEIIFGLYSQIKDRVEPNHGSFTTAEMNPSTAEVLSRIRQVVAEHSPNLAAN